MALPPLRVRQLLFALFQPSADPETLAFVRERLADGPSPRLLAFGCAGEAFALRRYFPHAFIKGIELDAAAVALATARRARARDINMSFAIAGSVLAEAARSYDAVFCLAPAQASFAAFARDVADFARCLKHGGFLVLGPGNFRFLDTDAARHFATVRDQVFRKAA